VYLSQQIEEVKGTGMRAWQQGATLTQWKVELDGTGRPAWKIRASIGTWWRHLFVQSHKEARSYGRKNWPSVPFMSDAAPGKLVTGSQAMKLTGVEHPMAAIDFLRDQLESNVGYGTIENFVKPKPAKEPKSEPVVVEPTAADVNQSKLTKARAKVAESEARVKHSEGKQREWRKAVRYRERRAHKLTTKEVAT
jgi:hypothetical protein